MILSRPFDFQYMCVYFSISCTEFVNTATFSAASAQAHFVHNRTLHLEIISFSEDGKNLAEYSESFSNLVEALLRTLEDITNLAGALLRVPEDNVNFTVRDIGDISRGGGMH